MPLADDARPNVTVTTDSTYVRNVLAGNSTPQANVALVERVRDRLSALHGSGVRVGIQHRKRMHALNAAADELGRTCVLLHAELGALTAANRRKAERLRGLPLTKLPKRAPRVSVEARLAAFEARLPYRRLRRPPFAAPRERSPLFEK